MYILLSTVTPRFSLSAIYKLRDNYSKIFTALPLTCWWLIILKILSKILKGDLQCNFLF